MLSCVIDASVALSWVLPGEDADKTLELRDLVINQPGSVLMAPPMFWYEVANALWVAVRRRRLQKKTAVEALNSLMEFGMDIWVADPNACLLLAAEHQLTVYDSAYLVVALETKSVLWTLDTSLARAAINTEVDHAPR